MATGTVQCEICLETKDPRLLPCDHSFCLGCHEGACKHKPKGADIPCSLCTNTFQIPKKGDTRRTQTNREPSAVCEACSTDKRCIPATVQCVDCSQKLCGNCGIRHAGGPHDVILLESAAPDLGGVFYCEKHEGERIKMYCFDCKMNACLVCCLEIHQTHKYDRIAKNVDDFLRSVDDEVKQVASRIKCYHGVVAQYEAEHSKTLDNIEEIELEVKKRCKRMKELVDRQESDFLQELQSLKSAAEKEVKSHTDTLQLALEELESFRQNVTHVTQMKSEGSFHDEKKELETTNSVHNDAKALLKKYVVPGEYRGPSYKFTAVKIDEFLKVCQNFTGRVVKDSGRLTSILINLSTTIIYRRIAIIYFQMLIRFTILTLIFVYT